MEVEYQPERSDTSARYWRRAIAAVLMLGILAAGFVLWWKQSTLAADQTALLMNSGPLQTFQNSLLDWSGLVRRRSWLDDDSDMIIEEPTELPVSQNP